MYKVQVNNGIAILGWLRRGKVVPLHAVAAEYYHPSGAKAAIKGFLKKNPSYICVIFKSNKGVFTPYEE